MKTIVERALVEPIHDIGQFKPEEKQALKKAIQKGIISKAKSGVFPALKTVYARPGFDFKQYRRNAMLDLCVIAPETSKDFEYLEIKGKKRASKEWGFFVSKPEINC